MPDPLEEGIRHFFLKECLLDFTRSEPKGGYNAMSAIIRLHAIPITDLPQRVKSEGPLESVAAVNCLLQSQDLPAHQHLEVRVNGVLQQGVPRR